jgi:hypothetical protein
MMRALISALALALLATPVGAHDIYVGLHAKGLLCCGGTDCASTIYREAGSHYEFLTREKVWVSIPEDRITFLPIPGDSDEDADPHRAHLCYKLAGSTERAQTPDRVFGPIFLFCAFIPPGAI